MLVDNECVKTIITCAEGTKLVDNKCVGIYTEEYARKLGEIYLSQKPDIFDRNECSSMSRENGHSFTTQDGKNYCMFPINKGFKREFCEYNENIPNLKNTSLCKIYT